MTEHGPGCWADHDECALTGAHFLAVNARDRAAGLAATFATALARLRTPGVADLDTALTHPLTAARAYLTAHGCTPTSTPPPRAREYANRKRPRR